MNILELVVDYLQDIGFEPNQPHTAAEEAQEVVILNMQNLLGFDGERSDSVTFAAAVVKQADYDSEIDWEEVAARFLPDESEES